MERSVLLHSRVLHRIMLSIRPRVRSSTFLVGGNDLSSTTSPMDYHVCVQGENSGRMYSNRSWCLHRPTTSGQTLMISSSWGGASDFQKSSSRGSHMPGIFAVEKLTWILLMRIAQLRRGTKDSHQYSILLAFASRRHLLLQYTVPQLRA